MTDMGFNGYECSPPPSSPSGYDGGWRQRQLTKPSSFEQRDVTEAAEGSDASEISSKLRNVAWGSEPDDDTSSSLMQKASASRDAFSANVVFMVACKILLGGGKRGNNIFLHAVVP